MLGRPDQGLTLLAEPKRIADAGFGGGVPALLVVLAAGARTCPSRGRTRRGFLRRRLLVFVSLAGSHRSLTRLASHHVAFNYGGMRRSARCDLVGLSNKSALKTEREFHGKERARAVSIGFPSTQMSSCHY